MQSFKERDYLEDEGDDGGVIDLKGNRMLVCVCGQGFYGLRIGPHCVTVVHAAMNIEAL